MLVSKSSDVFFSSKKEANISDYVSLLKPRVMMLVVFTASIGLFIAPGSLPLFVSVLCILSVALASGAAAAFNMWFDRDIDAIMERTQNRPIPAGKIHGDEALFMYIWLSLLSVMIMGLASGWFATGLLMLANGFYVLIYTVWLKRRTAQNIVIGGAAGAFPPMIGWVCVTGSIDVMSVVLFGIIFLWTPPHFWALALVRCDDYAAVGVPMLSVLKGKKVTRGWIFAYTMMLIPVAFLPYFLGELGEIYMFFSCVLGGLFIKYAWDVLLEKSGSENKLFFYSIFYLFVLFAAMALDHFWWA